MNDFITVSQLNDYIDGLIGSDVFLRNFWLKAEISGFKLYRQSGHMYFTLKDEESAISCVMFKSRNRNLDFTPEDGQEVLVRGYVSVFARQGKYQLYVEEMQPYGVGGLFLYLEKLKAKLAAKGYFAEDRKRHIPPVVNRVGVVTSQDGAAFHDILRVLKSRHKGVEVVLVHSTVQGMDAPREIAQGIQLLNEYGKVDVIIVGRGGGSLEDLMAFNSEEVVMAIYASEIPVISAVGHEVDFSLSDLAADLRAATPTQAAQLAVPDLAALEKEITDCRMRLIGAINRSLSYRSESLDRLMMRKVWKQPGNMVQIRQDYLDTLEKNLAKAVLNIKKQKEAEFSVAVAGLDSLSPLKVLNRGYAIVKRDDRIVKDIDEVKIGDWLKVSILNADIEVEVKDKEKVDRWKI